MGRRSIHSPEELRQRILEASHNIISKDGLLGLSAREIARLIGYSPGTLYNIFESLDHILLSLQVQLIGDAVAVLKAAPENSDPNERINHLASAYIDFALNNKRMWNVLFTHNLPTGMNAPLALHDNLNAMAAIVSEALTPLMPNASAADIDVAARTLWASVHGISAIAVTEKGIKMTPQTAKKFVKVLTTTYANGLRCS